MAAYNFDQSELHLPPSSSRSVTASALSVDHSFEPIQTCDQRLEPLPARSFVNFISPLSSLPEQLCCVLDGHCRLVRPFSSFHHCVRLGEAAILKSPSLIRGGVNKRCIIDGRPQQTRPPYRRVNNQHLDFLPIAIAFPRMAVLR